MNYSYLAYGTKVSALDAEGNGLLYLGSLIYKKTGDSIELESAGFAGGRFVAREAADGSVMVPMIHVSDHLGSVRAVVDGVSGEVVETNDYYPFGSRWDVATSLTDQTNRFRYNSKEELFRFGTPYIDYGARQYDPTLGRWFAQDPLAEKYYGISPYAFCAGNPVKYLDPDGEDFRKSIRGSSIIIKATYYTNRQSLKSATQAAAFWNERKDSYRSASGRQYTISYELKVQSTDNLNAFKDGSNTYEVVNSFDSKGRAGVTKEGHNVEVLDTYSTKLPDSATDSTTGAHEIGHTLGMEHSEQGIMSKRQDNSRTSEVTPDNLRQMLESERGSADILTILINLIFNVYEQK